MHLEFNAIDAARKTVARLLGNARADEILFKSCATESNNTAVFGTIAAMYFTGRTRLTRVQVP